MRNRTRIGNNSMPEAATDSEENAAPIVNLTEIVRYAETKVLATR
jgi:hypothetical protein